jgi:ABC-type Fe3+-hydroxamate transport system substrate-binding protein
VALRPDLVVVDREENRREDADALAAAGIPLHVLHVRALSDVGPALGGLADRLAIGPRQPGLGDDVGAEHIPPASGAPTGAPTGVHRRAFVPIWRRPWMSINGETYGSSLLEAAGVTNVLAGEPLTYPTVELTTVAALRPDVVLAPSEPYAFAERHRAELESVGPVVFVDGKDLFWWGARTPGALQRLRGLARQLADLRPAD